MGRTHASSYGSVLAPVYHNGKEPPSSDGSLSENEALQQCHRMRNISNTSRQVAHLVTQAYCITDPNSRHYRLHCQRRMVATSSVRRDRPSSPETSCHLLQSLPSRVCRYQADYWPCRWKGQHNLHP